jgi:hypothetical protein
MWEEETRRAGEENPGWSIYSSFCFTNDRETVEAIIVIAQRELEDFKTGRSFTLAERQAENQTMRPLIHGVKLYTTHTLEYSVRVSGIQKT